MRSLYRTFSHTFTYDGSNNGNYCLQINVARGHGEIYISDLKLTEDNSTTVSVINSEAIGELPAVPEKEGYNGYWTIDGEKISSNTVYDYGADKTAVLVYEAIKKYDVTFDYGNGTTETKTYVEGAKMGTLPAFPNEKGYDYAWTIDDEVISADTAYNYGENKTAVLKAVKKEYSLTFDGIKTIKPSKPLGEYTVTDNMSDKAEAASVVTDGDALKITFNDLADGKGATINFGSDLNVEKDKNYKFSVALKMADADPEGAIKIRLNLVVKNGNSNIKIQYMTAAYAEWTVYTFAFKAVADGDMRVRVQLGNGGGNPGYAWIKDINISEISTVKLHYGDALGSLPEAEAKEFYNGEWYIDDKKITEGFAFEYDKDVTATVKYTPVEYTITFVAEGKEVGTAKYTVETSVDEIVYPSIPDKDGHAGQWTEFDPTLGGDRIVSAFYDIDVSVIYKNAQGETLSSGTVKYGSTLGNLPEIEEKTGYMACWTVDGEEIDADYIVNATDKLEIISVYTAIEYTITFFGKDGVILGQTKYTVETNEADIVYPEVPAVDGSTEGEWEKFNVKNGGDVSLYYEYAKISAKVTFLDEEGKVIESRKVKLGERLGELPNVEVKEGYSVKWIYGEETITADTVIAEDISVRLTYEKTEQKDETSGGCSANAYSDLGVLFIVLVAAVAITIKSKKNQL